MVTLTKQQLVNLQLINVNKDHLLSKGICDDEVYFSDPRPLFDGVNNPPPHDMGIADYIKGVIPGVLIYLNNEPKYFVYVYDLSNWGIMDHVLVLPGHDYMLLLNLWNFSCNKVYTR